MTETWPPEINGVALSLLQLCQGLQKQGHKILLVRPEQKPNVMIFARTRMSGDVTSDSKISNFAIWLAPIFKSFKSFEKFVPDVVHIVTEGPLGLTAMQAAKAKNIPVSSGFHSPFQDFSRFFDLAFW